MIDGDADVNLELSQLLSTNRSQLAYILSTTFFGGAKMARVQYKTAPQVAQQLGVKYHWLRYWCDEKGLVNPIVAGQYRLFTQPQIEVLRRHLESTKGEQ